MSGGRLAHRRVTPSPAIGSLRDDLGRGGGRLMLVGSAAALEALACAFPHVLDLGSWQAVSVVAVVKPSRLGGLAVFGGPQAAVLIARDRVEVHARAERAARDACRALGHVLPADYRVAGGWRAARALATKAGAEHVLKLDRRLRLPRGRTALWRALPASAPVTKAIV